MTSSAAAAAAAAAATASKWSPPRKVAVVGAGVVGLATALRLQLDGHQVTMFSRTAPGTECSYGMAGIIASHAIESPHRLHSSISLASSFFSGPSAPFRIDPVYYFRSAAVRRWAHDLIRNDSLAAQEQLASARHGLLRHADSSWEELQNDTQNIPALQKRGCLTVFNSGKDRVAFDSILRLRAEHNIPFEEVSGAALRSLEPGLKSTIHNAAIFSPDVQYCPNTKGVLSALFKTFQDRGGRFFMEPVSEIEITQSVAWTSVQDRRLAPLTSQHVPISALQRPSAMQVIVTESGRKFPVNRVVVANGVEAGKILKKLEYDQLPLVVDRGASVQMPRSKEAITRPIHIPSAAAYVTTINDAPLCSGTSYITSSTAPNSDSTTRFLRRMGKSLIDYENSYDLLDERDDMLLPKQCWHGDRVALPDGLPILGELPLRPEVIAAVGYGHHGFTLAAVSANIIAGMVRSGGPGDWAEAQGLDMRPYSIDRFNKQN